MTNANKFISLKTLDTLIMDRKSSNYVSAWMLQFLYFSADSPFFLAGIMDFTYTKVQIAGLTNRQFCTH